MIGVFRRLTNSSGKNQQKQIYDQFSNSMFRLCLRYLKNEMDAEETLHEGFLKVFAHLHSFENRGDGAMEAWIKKIMVNEALMFLRKQNGIRLFIEKELVKQIEPVATDSGLLEEDLLNLLHKLPPGYRAVFNLFAIEGYTHKEIGAMLNIDEGTSKSQLSKAREMLRSMIKREAIYESK